MEKKSYYSRTNLKYLASGRIISKASVKTVDKGKSQKVWVQVAGQHQRNCSPVLQKISQYEKYASFMDFVNKSTYKNGLAQIQFKLSLLPVSFIANIKIKRIDRLGTFPFTLSMKGLKSAFGHVFVKEVDKKCLIYAEFQQKGIHFGFSDFLMENFFSTVAKLGLRKLFMITGHRPSQ